MRFLGHQNAVKRRVNNSVNILSPVKLELRVVIINHLIHSAILLLLPHKHRVVVIESPYLVQNEWEVWVKFVV